MYGGTIIGNNASIHGGGVNVGISGVSNAEFRMYGGAVCYNTSLWGGGVNGFGSLYIYDGCEIINNTASSGGGGFELESGGRLYMNGGTVMGNRVLTQNGGMWKGAGVHVPNGTEFHIQGSVVVKDNYQGSTGTAQNNVFVRKEVPGKVILDGALASDANIGVGTNGSIPFVITSGYSTYHNTADELKTFFSDRDEYITTVNASGQVQIAVKPVASVTVGDTVTEYGTISEAVNAWTNASNGAVLTLQKDVTTNAAIDFKGTKALDLNGYGIRYAGSGKASVLISSAWNNNSGSAGLTINDSNPQRLHRITLSGYRGMAVETVDTLGDTAVDANGNGTVYVSGGYITGGTGTLLSGSIYIGGALYIRGDTKAVTINGGTFVGNVCDFGGMAHSSHGSIAVNGGSIIYNKGNGAAFNMDGKSRLYLCGGEIAHNTSGIRYATDNGSVLSLGGSNGSTAFTDNGEYDIWLASGKVINIGGTLTNTTPVGVKMAAVGKFTANWTTRMGEADPANYFVSNDSGYEVAADEQTGEGILTLPYVRGVSAEGYTGNYDGASHTVTVTAPDGVTVAYGTKEGSYSLSQAPV